MNWAKHTLLATVITAASTEGGGAGENPLAPHLWAHRPIVMFAPREDDGRLREQLALFAEHRAGMVERDIVIVVVAGGKTRIGDRSLAGGPALRNRFRIADETFAAILIGKDGSEKMRRLDVTAPQVFYSLIDTMPMRREEMSEGE